MNLNLNHEGFEQHLVTRRPCNGGVQYMFKFENGYGASVIKHDFSYGNDTDHWELAVIKWTEDGSYWDLCYDTDITDDVIGGLTDKAVRELLQEIKEL